MKQTTIYDAYKELQQMELDSIEHQRTLDQLEEMEPTEEHVAMIKQIREELERMDIRTSDLLKLFQTIPLDISPENVGKIIAEHPDKEWEEIEFIV